MWYTKLDFIDNKKLIELQMSENAILVREQIDILMNQDGDGDFLKPYTPENIDDHINEIRRLWLTLECAESYKKLISEHYPEISVSISEHVIPEQDPV